MILSSFCNGAIQWNIHPYLAVNKKRLTRAYQACIALTYCKYNQLTAMYINSYVQQCQYITVDPVKSLICSACGPCSVFTSKYFHRFGIITNRIVTYLSYTFPYTFEYWLILPVLKLLPWVWFITVLLFRAWRAPTNHYNLDYIQPHLFCQLKDLSLHFVSFVSSVSSN